MHSHIPFFDIASRILTSGQQERRHDHVDMPLHGEARRRSPFFVTLYASLIGGSFILFAQALAYAPPAARMRWHRPCSLSVGLAKAINREGSKPLKRVNLKPKSPRQLSERTVSLIFFALGLTALAASLVVQFGVPLTNGPVVKTDVATTTAEDEIAELESEVATEDGETIRDDEGIEESDVDYDVPESLRMAALPFDPAVISVFTQLGLNETLLPSSFFPQPGTTVSVGPGRDAVLDDHDDRISEAFHIPAELRDRTGFWFDVYTKHDSNQRIIHHALYPWIVFKIVDVSAIVNSDTPKHLWMRRMKADRLVKSESLKVRAALKRIASKRRGTELNEAESSIADALTPLGGNLRKQAVRAMHSVRIQTGQRDFFFEGLQLSARYLGTMERIFESHRLPVELTRIPFVESSFNRAATSKVGAAGVWQIMEGTGRKFMRIDGTVDERRSPLKATEAAARLLKENHMILRRSWPLAVSAWNHGPGGIRKAAQRAGTYDLGKIISRYRSRSFDFASSNFYCEFLAALHAERYSAEIFGAIDRSHSETLRVVKLARSMRFNDLLDASGMHSDEFLAWNPEISKIAKQNLHLPRGFRLHLPDWASENIDRRLAMQKSRNQPAG